jgi:hypothetical protein
MTMAMMTIARDVPGQHQQHVGSRVGQQINPCEQSEESDEHEQSTQKKKNVDIDTQQKTQNTPSKPATHQ